MFNNWPNEISQTLLSFFNPKERSELASVTRDWQIQVDDQLYWKKQVQSAWPSFFSGDRFKKIHQLKIDYKKLFILIDSLSLDIKSVMSQEKKLDFMTVLQIISEVPQAYQELFVSLIDENEANGFFKSTQLYRLLLDLSIPMENTCIRYFSKYLKSFTNSGWMLHACVGNVTNKKAYLSLFSEEELFNLCNDVKIRQYSHFNIIKNYLLLKVAIKKIDDGIKDNKYVGGVLSYFLPPQMDFYIKLKQSFVSMLSTLETSNYQSITHQLATATFIFFPRQASFCKRISEAVNLLYTQLISDHIFLVGNDHTVGSDQYESLLRDGCNIF